MKRLITRPAFGILFLGAMGFLAAAQRSPGQFPDFGGFGSQAGGGQGNVSVSAEFAPADDDRPAVLFVTAEIDSGWHIGAIDQASGGPQKTTITVSNSSSYRQLGPFQAIDEPHSYIDQEIWPGLEIREHERRVTWFAPIEIAEGVDPTSLTIGGTIAGQACDQLCVIFNNPFTAKLGSGAALPDDVSFTFASTVDGAAEPGAPLSSTAQSRSVPENGNAKGPDWRGAEATDVAPLETYNLEQVQLESREDESLLYYLALAFVGGLILNVMPCVLPVIGLKVMSFVQQAGESRARAWSLNLWYSIGIIIVFLGLAGLAVFLRSGWGFLFSSAAFNVSLTAVVFAMALSLLGMWEIPIPGFIGAGAAVEMAEREGPLGALLKGVLTTLLATPCVGPFMVTALVWAVSESPATAFSVFGMLGLGMASPYLLIGAFPRLVRFIPKPGAWMETFKKVMGLVLLATVVWLLTFLDPPMVVPTVALMVGIAAACWWISQTPLTAPLEAKAYAWVTASLFVAIVAMGSYGWFYKSVMLERYQRRVDLVAERQLGEERTLLVDALARVENPQQLAELRQQLAAASASTSGQWQPFTLERLAQLTMSQGRTVLVDFTADWCATCHVLEATVLKTNEVEAALEEAQIVTMIADYTKQPEWMTQTIYALGGIGVPVIAIFPANDPYHPIVFPSGYTKGSLLSAIEEATRGPAAETAGLSATAAR